MRIIPGLLILLLAGSCFETASLPADSDAFEAPRKVAELKSKKLEEVSGLAASAANPGLLWVHNDSGNPATVFLVDNDLNIRLACRLKGVENRDWEDIAVAPGPEPGVNYVYIADIGDNNARYEEKRIYRFREPVLEEGPADITISSFDVIAFRLEDGEKDTEAIMVHPETRNIYVISKREKPVHVYELSYPFSEPLIGRSIVTLPLTQVVAADISPDGEEVIIKNYDNIYYWHVGEKALAEALKEKPGILRYNEEPQGEAIGFNREASGFYTLSETLKGEKTFLYFYERTKP